MALLLIAMGADVTGKTDNGMTALHQAGRNGHAALVDLRVRKGQMSTQRLPMERQCYFGQLRTGTPYWWTS
jgi:ankyrin repeat protein